MMTIYSLWTDEMDALTDQPERLMSLIREAPTLPKDVVKIASKPGQTERQRMQLAHFAVWVLLAAPDPESEKRKKLMAKYEKYLAEVEAQRYAYYAQGYWLANGRAIPLTKMDDNYLLNVIGMLKADGHDDESHPTIGLAGDILLSRLRASLKPRKTKAGTTVVTSAEEIVIVQQEIVESEKMPSHGKRKYNPLFWK